KSTAQYLEFDDDEGGRPTDESIQKAFSCIPRIASVSRRPEHESRFLYIRGIMRKRFSYVDAIGSIQLTRGAYELGADIDWLQRIAVESRNWSNWRQSVTEFIISRRDAEE